MPDRRARSRTQGGSYASSSSQGSMRSYKACSWALKVTVVIRQVQPRAVAYQPALLQ